MKKGFTLIEILVVATIIALLAAAGVTSYSALVKNSRDSKRKADIEQYRAALEQYRSNNNYYPTAITTLVPAYISAEIADPLTTQGYSYRYEGRTCVVAGCSDYRVGAYLEGTSSCGSGEAPSTACYGSTACNYCMSPYGKK